MEDELNLPYSDKISTAIITTDLVVLGWEREEAILPSRDFLPPRESIIRWEERKGDWLALLLQSEAQSSGGRQQGERGIKWRSPHFSVMWPAKRRKSSTSGKITQIRAKTVVLIKPSLVKNVCSHARNLLIFLHRPREMVAWPPKCIHFTNSLRTHIDRADRKLGVPNLMKKTPSRPRSHCP